MSLYPHFHELVALKKRKWKGNSSLKPVKSPDFGGHVSHFRGQGLEFDAVRHYVVGDDIRAIDWRVTARIGVPHIKLYKDERERHHLICLDTNETMRFGTKQTFKSVQAAKVAALLGWRGIANRDRVSACLFGDVPSGIQIFPPKRMGKNLCSWLKMLAQPPSESHQIGLDKALQPLSRAHTGSLVYVISDFLAFDENVEKALHPLIKKCSVVFIAINDPFDKVLYPMGSIGFVCHSQKMFINTSSHAEAYSAQWKENREQLYELTGRLKIPLIELTTESDPYPTLLKRLSK